MSQYDEYCHLKKTEYEDIDEMVAPATLVVMPQSHRYYNIGLSNYDNVELPPICYFSYKEEVLKRLLI